MKSGEGGTTSDERWQKTPKPIKESELVADNYNDDDGNHHYERDDDDDHAERKREGTENEQNGVIP